MRDGQAGGGENRSLVHMAERAQAGRAVVITGASTGIGRATARHLDQPGCRVFAGIRSPEAAEGLRRTR